MRVLGIAAILALTAPLSAAAAPRQQQLPSSPSADCPATASHPADAQAKGGSDQLMPQKLTELPAATAYMAVYRRIAGCEAPMTAAEYRRHTRR